MPSKTLASAGALVLCLAPGVGRTVTWESSNDLSITAHNRFSTPHLEATVTVRQGSASGARAALPFEVAPASDATPVRIVLPESTDPPPYAWLFIEFHSKGDRRSCSGGKELSPSEFASDGVTFAQLTVTLAKSPENTCEGVVDLTWNAKGVRGSMPNNLDVAIAGRRLETREVVPSAIRENEVTHDDVTTTGVIILERYVVSEPCYSSSEVCLRQTFRKGHHGASDGR